MNRTHTLRILVLNESDNECERLVSLFRSAGRVARLHRVTHQQDLHNQLTQTEWDVAIANNLHPELSPEKFLTTIQNLQPMLPVIVITDDDPTELLNLGVEDIIHRDDIDTRLVHATLREANYHEQCRDLKHLQQELSQAEQRSALLLAESSDAIAYIAEGMIINANDLFATRFGYCAANDLDCMAFVDLIQSTDHDKLKAMLKSIVHSGKAVEFTFAGLTSSGDTFDATMELLPTTFDGENCIQVVVRDSMSQAILALTPDAGITHLPASLFNDALTTAITQATHGGGHNSFIFLRVDNIRSWREKLGLTQTQQLLQSVADSIKHFDATFSTVSLYCDDGVGIISQQPIDATLPLLEKLIAHIQQYSFELNGHVIHLTTTGILIAIDAKTDQAASDLIDLAYTSCDELRNNDGIGNCCAVREPKKTKKALAANADIQDLIHNGLEDNRFTLAFQPIISLDNAHDGDHYEVILQLLNDAEQNILDDTLYASLADNNSDTKLDRWQIVEATKRLAIKRSQNADIRLFINATAATFHDETLLPWLKVALNAADIPAHALIFQFREIDIQNNLNAAKATLTGLHHIGCRTAISQFGPQTDSRQLLNHIDASFVRTDATLTQALQANTTDSHALKDLVSHVQALNKKVVIPLVENATVLAQLWQIGPNYMQGNFLQSPLSEMNHEFADIA